MFAFTMMLAEISAEGYCMILVALFVGIMQVANLIVGYLRERAKIARENQIADKVAEVAAETAKVKLAAEAAARLVAEVAVKTAIVAKKQDLAVEAVHEVKDTLLNTVNSQDEKLAGIAQTAHKLVNSALSVQLRANVVSLRRIAELTKHPDDVEAVVNAEALYREHEATERPFE